MGLIPALDFGRECLPEFAALKFDPPNPSRPVERYFSHSQLFIQADCSRRIVHLNFQIDVLHAPTPKFPKYFPQECRRDSAPTHQGMDNQVFDEGAGPALSDSDNLLPIVDREKTKVGGKFAVISKARPPPSNAPMRPPP
jgi:hypothetical protein